MKVWFAVAAAATLFLNVTTAPAHDSMAMDGAPPATTTAPAANPTPAAQPTPAELQFAQLAKLVGKWEAPLQDGKTIVDTFQPFAFGTAILAEEWVGAEQVTSTVFYLVGGELWADHFCDYKNQPRYLAKPSSDPKRIELEFRSATNLDTHPVHFHSTTWQLLDGEHMTQDWHVEGSKKGPSTVHLEFLRKS